MQTTERRMLEFDPRYWRMNARAAIRDVYDALVELITNPDDRYVHLAERGQFIKPGLIEIEVDRKRKGSSSIIRVRDFADGMTNKVMSEKLARVGKRVSGMAEGVPVRGTHSRGAKDIAILGGVTFESIGQDGGYHKCEISARGQFTLYPSADVTKAHRKELGIPEGTGTLVTLVVDPAVAKVPQHETLRGKLRDLVPLRDILSSPERRVVLRDLSKGREDTIEFHSPEGKKRLSERLAVPGYEKADAKLVIYRAAERLERGNPKFRIGGILIRSRRAIHEATLFAPELEHDPHAAWFFGKLTCEYIDVLSNELDDREEKGLEPSAANPRPVVDPARRSGLDREHPFVEALFKEVLKRLRPLVEEERKREESTKTDIESDQTRRRLRALEKAAAEFMAKHREEEDIHSRSSEDTFKGSFFSRKGYSLNPPFAQILVGHGARFWLNINQADFAEFSVGNSIDISYATADLSGPRSCALEQHPNQEGVLRCVWTVKGVKPTKATAVKVRLNGIAEERMVEVLASEKEKYSNIVDLCFSHKWYSIPTDRSKKVMVLAPYPSVISQEVTCELQCSDPAFRVPSSRKIVPCERLGVAVCEFHVATEQPDIKAEIIAKAAGRTCEAGLVSVPPSGAAPEVKIEPVDFKNQRYRWHGNIIQVAAFHPSLRRYLGSAPEKFPGQHNLHFRVLLAEIVADAVCSKILERRVIVRPEEYQDADWQDYSADFTKLMTEFLPIAHETQIPEKELGR